MQTLTNERLWALPHDSAQNLLSSLAAELTAELSPRAAGTPNAPRVASSPYQVRNGVALIRINGTITRTSIFGWNGAQLTQGQDAIEAALDAALADPSVNSILFDVNSPGGTVAGTKELADRIAAAAKVKPTAAYANGLMASAAIWLGAATGRVLAPVTAMVGSVGVIMVHTDWSRAFERFGVTRSYITAGRWKAAGNPDAPLGESERAHFQGQVNAIHEVFKSDVASGLGVTAPPEQWAEGQTMLAGEAQVYGLVSQIVRDLDSAIQTLRQEQNMQTQTPVAVQPALPVEANAPKAETPRQEAATNSAAPDAAISAAVEAARSDLLAMAEIVAGPEAHDKLTRLISAGVTAQQLEAVSPILGPILSQGAALPESGAEAKARAQILAGLEAVTPGMVAGASVQPAPAKSKLVADAERRAETRS